ncbi:hypothetical protein BO99DRAFT_123818 [Aspergillus violaceofuscus CBS 115571]|uniref:Uncharacterized protein n=1 Tax=Aspergillus violaceofuscus (strain CBS 115571) TaxID=1450538 RepID=A0A2V5IVD9_ASPV1|nr:hypothetical protein BO99DRAFT_123818 [Aspergillus violaceofuscus CBS 115571]
MSLYTELGDVSFSILDYFLATLVFAPLKMPLILPVSQPAWFLKPSPLRKHKFSSQLDQIIEVHMVILMPEPWYQQSIPSIL